MMRYIIEHEGVQGLFKGIGPQILKGLLVQGFLMMTKERMELLFIVLFRYLRKVRQEQLQKYAEIAKAKARPLADKAAEQARRVAPVLVSK